MKRTLAALFFIFTTILLVVSTAYIITNTGKANESDSVGMFIVAQELGETPQIYFSVENPDSFVSQAIAEPGKIIFVGDRQNTNIDDLIEENVTRNVKINNRYYDIDIGSADPTSVIDTGFTQAVTAGWIVWTIALVIVIVFLRLRKGSNQLSGNKNFALKCERCFLIINENIILL